MQLADAWIHGFRRFGGARPHRLRLDAKLVCLIGANEVGKATLLAALESVEFDEPLAPEDRSRLEAVPDDREVVRLRYRLDSEDHAALQQIATDIDPRGIHWFDVIHRANGSRAFDIDTTLNRIRGPRAG